MLRHDLFTISNIKCIQLETWYINKAIKTSGKDNNQKAKLKTKMVWLKFESLRYNLIKVKAIPLYFLVLSYDLNWV
jgi:hypothetical protein